VRTSVASEHRLDRFVSRARCWWFGCEEHPQECCHSDADMFTCLHCGEEVSYSDLVGDTRHNRAKAWAHYWLWRKWWPYKCADCGGRWRHDEGIDHLPF
jgi:hypothetical protein